MKKNPSVITLGIIDPNILYSQPFGAYLQEQEAFEVLFVVSTAAEAFKREVVDLLLIETAINPEGGMPLLSVAEKIQQEYSCTKLVALCSSFEIPLSARLQQKGCLFFLQKRLRPELFCEALVEIGEKSETRHNWTLEHTAELRAYTNQHLKVKLLRNHQCFLKLLQRGWSHQEIATHLYVSVATIKSYTTRLQGKFGIKGTKMALVEYAMRMGYIDPTIEDCP